MEIEPPIDWQKRRKEILARLEEEEKTRLEKIEKARRLTRGWEMTGLCKEIIKENAKGWEERRKEAEVEEESSLTRQTSKRRDLKRKKRQKQGKGR